jgi:shikimate dehydrogenase
VIGHPISHSLSPQMHAAALAQLSAADPHFADWTYSPFDIEAADLATALDRMAAHGFRGVNLTVPHKVIAVGLVSSLDEGAREAGAVNTLLSEKSGWRGFNTDGYGLSTSLREDLGISLGGATVVLLGAGGAARGAAVECLRAGCAGLWILNRTRPNLEALVAQLLPLARGIPVHPLDEASAAVVPRGSIVINATSAGLRAADTAPVDLDAFADIAAVYDMIYNPAMTPLLCQARALGIPHANGLGMLVHQGAKSLEIWTGAPARDTAPAMRRAAAKALGS